MHKKIDIFSLRESKKSSDPLQNDATDRLTKYLHNMDSHVLFFASTINRT